MIANSKLISVIRHIDGCIVLFVLIVDIMSHVMREVGAHCWLANCIRSTFLHKMNMYTKTILQRNIVFETVPTLVIHLLYDLYINLKDLVPLTMEGNNHVSLYSEAR